MMHNKKGVELWVSWVLLVASAVVASVFMFTWMTDYATETNEEITRTFENAQQCDSVSIEIRACQEITRNVVNVNATNRGLLTIDKIIFRLYDAHDDVSTRQINKTIRPNVKKSFPVVRQDAVVNIEAVPVLYDDAGNEIICTKRLSQLDTVGTC